jgi:hypothetical protein
VLILNVVKVVCFDTLLQVLILNVVTRLRARSRRAGRSEDRPLQPPVADGGPTRWRVRRVVIGESERTQRGITAIEAIGGHGVSKRKIGIFGGVSQRRGALLNESSLPERLL